MLIAHYLICPNCKQMIGNTAAVQFPELIPLIIQCSNCSKYFTIKPTGSETFDVQPIFIAISGRKQIPKELL